MKKLEKKEYTQGLNKMIVLDIKGDYALICKLNNNGVKEYVIAYSCEINKNNEISWCSGNYYFNFDFVIQEWLDISDN